MFFLYLYLGIFGVIEVEYPFTTELGCETAGKMQVANWRKTHDPKWSPSTYVCIKGGDAKAP